MDSADPRASANYETTTGGVELNARISLAYEAATTPHYDEWKPLVEMAREHGAERWREDGGNDTQSYARTQPGRPFRRERGKEERCQRAGGGITRRESRTAFDGRTPYQRVLSAFLRIYQVLFPPLLFIFLLFYSLCLSCIKDTG